MGLSEKAGNRQPRLMDSEEDDVGRDRPDHQTLLFPSSLVKGNWLELVEGDWDWEETTWGEA